MQISKTNVGGGPNNTTVGLETSHSIASANVGISDILNVSPGSCYGLIFFVCFDECVLLWNPTTEKTRLIPDPLTPFPNATRFYGLGYDFSIDDYKMVSASRSISSSSISCQVFNLKSGSWRTVQTAHMSINDPDIIGSFSNGAIHWIVRHSPHDDGFNNRKIILSLRHKRRDLYGNCFGENEQSEFWCLGDLKGCLYAVYGGDDGVDMEVWVMKEYGIESSWSKVIKLDWIRFGCDYGMTPGCFTYEDDVVIDLDSWDLVRFSVKDNQIKRFRKCSTDWHLWVVYYETLVSPYG
ncbi:F-box/kelch-repeat protein At3g06240-like [Bidens hawaiensis]|uniref:F-box/kelch-repeat protein At3g06240-like n=1 Tax=Bidens hawaiensis TaxID=980011 RepID=UPI00404972F7